MTAREALTWVTDRLSEIPLLRDKALLDARALLETATGWSRVAVLAHPERALSAEQERTLLGLLQRRLTFEPVQHLRGSQEFYGRSFHVTPDVLIPRPETEDIISAVLENVPDRNAPLHIADVGTGSGVLAITLALELPCSTVEAYDVSPEALAVAVRNAAELRASGRIRFLQSDLFAAAGEQTFDLIVSNPPYIPLGDMPALHPEVREHEPHLALFAGEDGHDVYRRLIPEAHSHLRSGGLLLLETGGRVDLISDLLENWADVRVRPDLQGIARIVSARRK